MQCNFYNYISKKGDRCANNDRPVIHLPPQKHGDKMKTLQVSFYHKTVLLHRFYFYTFL